MLATKLAFEKTYPDGSGIEYAVRYDRLSDREEIEIQVQGDQLLSFPIEELPFFLKSLLSISTHTELQEEELIEEK